MSIQPTRGVDWLRLLPRYWFQNNRTDRVWDAALDKAIDAFGVKKVDSHTCMVGPFEVWIANWPYAYGNQYGVNDYLPMAKTRRKLRRAVEQMPGQAERLGRQIEAALARQEQAA